MKKLCLSGLLALTLTSPALMAEDWVLAQEEDQPGNMYANVSLLYSDADCNYANVDCEGFGWKLQGGYKFSDHIAVEGGYYKLFSNEDTDSTTTLKSTVNASGLAMSGVGSYAIDDKISLFGKVGLMAWEAEANTNGIVVDTMDGTDILLGVGGAYKLSDNWGIRGELEHVGGDLEVTAYSLGATMSTL